MCLRAVARPGGRRPVHNFSKNLLFFLHLIDWIVKGGAIMRTPTRPSASFVKSQACQPTTVLKNKGEKNKGETCART